MNPTVRSVSDLEEALEALDGAGDETRVLAGGTDLMVEFDIGRTRPDRVVDIWRVDALRGIAMNGDRLKIGALTTCTELLASALVAAHADILATAAREVGAVQIRNRATIGGNLGTASPAADLNPVLIALDAEVGLVSLRGRRELPAGRFLTGYRATRRQPDELIECVTVPARASGERRAFRKVGTRAAQSIAKVVVAIAARLEGAKVAELRAAAGSVAPRTVRLAALQAALVSGAASASTIDAAIADSLARDIAPIDDVRSSAFYRRQALGRLLRSMLSELLLPRTRP